MTRAVRILMAVVLVATGLASALMLAGCDDEAVAEVASAQGVGSIAVAPPASVQPQEPAVQTPIAAAGDGAAAALQLSVEELIMNTEAYVGQEVVVRGIILTQCIRGCQFSLDDDTGVIGIELVEEALENVLMTGSVGRTVEVRGIVEGGSRPLILVKDRDGWRYVD
ncbi:hypothetical protein ACFLTM_00835 [Candidatus Bipolaricaulota bacterium]